MDAIQRGVILLLKSAITGEKYNLPEGFDIEEAYARTKKHHMTSLIYAGAVNCGVDSANPAMQKLFQSYCRALQVNGRQMGMLKRLFDAFEENGIDYLPMKGSMMKAMYPQPELRLMGDADILIRMEQYEKIVPIMEGLGFAVASEDDTHFVWDSETLHAELHRCLISPRYDEAYDYFQSGWLHAKAEEGRRYNMSIEDTFAFLLAHFAQHYRSGGIGCRHVTDLWVYLRRNPDMDEQQLCAILERMQLRSFYWNVRRMISVWFEGEALDERSEFMTQVIFSSGSWGTASNAMPASGVWEMKKTKNVARIRFAYIWRLLFLKPEAMKNMYPILQNMPWLLPVMWVYRWADKLVKSPKRLKRYARNIRVLNKEQLEDRKKALEYVGLFDEE